MRHFIVTKNKGTEETVNEAYNEFQNNLEKAYFSDNSPIQLFPGVIELFDLLRANGIVVTLNTGIHSHSHRVFPHLLTQQRLSKEAGK